MTDGGLDRDRAPSTDGCPDANALAQMLEGQLSAEALADLSAHVDGCAGCQALLVELAPVVTPSEDEAGVEAGSRVLRYEIVEVLGSGGMGVVYLAFDPDLDRRIALKVLHRSDGDAQVRIRREARALARLSHPNVVQVHEVGQYAGGSYVAMELVEGPTLSQWAAQRPWRERLDACRQAGEGLAAAHVAGLVHRDLKPSNVVCGDDGRVRVIDFGLVGAPVPRGAATVEEVDVRVTKTGSVLGTPAYMAPEQRRGGAADESSDQFGFCVTTWEVLAGAHPFADGPGQIGAWPPEAPPVRAAVLAVLRRGMATEASQRWPSMQALLRALSRAMAPRRWPWVAAAAASTAAVVAWWPRPQCTGAAEALQGVWDAAQRERVQAAMLGTEVPYAERAWDYAAATLDAYADGWMTMHREACEASTVRGEQSPETMDLRMACLHRAKVELKAATDALGEADAEAMAQAHTVVGDLADLDRCANVEALQAEVEPPRPQDVEAVRRIETLVAEAKAARKLARYEDAQRLVDEAKALMRGIEYAPVEIEVGFGEGVLLSKLGKYNEAEEVLMRALELSTERRSWRKMQWLATELLVLVGAQQKRPDDAMSRYRMLSQRLSDEDAASEAMYRTAVGVVLRQKGSYEEAEAELSRALTLRERALGADHLAVAQSLYSLSIVRRMLGSYEEAATLSARALAIEQRSLGPDHPRVASSRSNLANVLFAQGKYEEAEAEHRAALALRETALGPDHPAVALSRNNLGNALFAQGKYEEAEAEFRASQELLEGALGADHPDVAASRSNLATVLYAQGKYEEAEAEHRAVLALRETALGPDHPNVAYSRSNLANVLYMQGKYEEAEAEHRVAVALWGTALGPAHPDGAVARVSLGVVLAAQGKHDEAEAECRAALALLVAALGLDHPHVAMSRHHLAFVLVEQQRPEEALPLAEQAWVRRRQDDIPPEQRAETAFLLARVRWAQTPRIGSGRMAARKLAERALQTYQRSGDAFAEQADEVSSWLREHPAR